MIIMIIKVRKPESQKARKPECQIVRISESQKVRKSESLLLWQGDHDKLKKYDKYEHDYHYDDDGHVLPFLVSQRRLRFAESPNVRKSESQKVRKPESQKARMSDCQNFRISKSQKVRKLAALVG